MSSINLNLVEHSQPLLDLANASILHGLETRQPISVILSAYETALASQRATFVTLEIGNRLRGCMGTLEAVRPLVEDIAHNAFAAAFSDPRFPPLGRAEVDQLLIHISILSLPVEMSFESEHDLLAQLQPGQDGLILEDGTYRGTFLPSVWDSLPDPESFFMQLKQKAGLPQDHWSDNLKVFRYHTEVVGP